jgi:hypothetical protein
MVAKWEDLDALVEEFSRILAGPPFKVGDDPVRIRTVSKKEEARLEELRSFLSFCSTVVPPSYLQ